MDALDYLFPVGDDGNTIMFVVKLSDGPYTSWTRKLDEDGPEVEKAIAYLMDAFGESDQVKDNA